VGDVAHGSWVDGPGMRTVIFLKGCPLRCTWCHNPEFQRADGAGRALSAERLASLAARDRLFFAATGGGVTFSGGEPLLFIDYVADVAAHLVEQGIHITIETCGYFDLPHYSRKLEKFVSLLLFDVKIVDADEHRRWTGAENALILRNLAALVERGTKLRVRTPLVPGITATEKNLDDIARLMPGRVELLPYNAPASEGPMPMEEEARWRRYFDLRCEACATPSITSSSAPAPPDACSPIG